VHVYGSEKFSGHPPSNRYDKMLAEVLDLVREDQRLTIKEVVEGVGVFFLVHAS
jgi:hypothetical protein